jgi:hypothetical protein
MRVAQQRSTVSCRLERLKKRMTVPQIALLALVVVAV